MSHFSNRHWHKDGAYGQPLAKFESTHEIRHCWGCNVEMVQKIGAIKSPKICGDCKKTLTKDQIKQLYKNHKIHRNQMIAARKSRPDEQKHIFNSPFRKGNNS